MAPLRLNRLRHPPLSADRSLAGPPVGAGSPALCAVASDVCPGRASTTRPALPLAGPSDSTILVGVVLVGVVLIGFVPPRTRSNRQSSCSGSQANFAKPGLVTAAEPRARGVTLAAGARQTVRLTGPRLTPVADLAFTKRTFPTSPLPPGMSDPDLTVDGGPATAWQPGPGGAW